MPVRPSEVDGRRGKRPDGSAKTREVKLVTAWTAEGRAPQGRPRRDTGSVSYNAAVESAASRDTDPQPAAFAQRVQREAQRRGFDTTPRRVVLGDGAPGIWSLAAEQFPGAIEIVDIYHAKQHLCDVAKAIYGAGTDLADAWAKARQAELDAGRLRALVTALRTQASTTPEARQCIHYVFGNRHRMRYPQFRARGLCISSGVVEAGCKRLGARLKRAGMRWTVAGTNAILALRCLHPQRPKRPRVHREARRRGFDTAPARSSSATAPPGSGTWPRCLARLRFLLDSFSRPVRVVSGTRPGMPSDTPQRPRAARRQPGDRNLPPHRPFGPLARVQAAQNQRVTMGHAP